MEAHGKQKRENEDICFCVCPSTTLGAAAVCAISTAWETSQGAGLSIPEHLRSQQAEAEHTALLHHNALLHRPPEMLSDPTISKTALKSTYQPSLL